MREAEPPDPAIRERIAEQMRRHRLSAREVEKRAPVNSSQFRRIRSGKIGIGRKTAEALARVFGVSAAFLMGIEDNGRAPTSTIEPRVVPANQDEETLIENYRGLDRSTSAALLAVLGVAPASKGIRSGLQALAELAEEGALATGAARRGARAGRKAAGARRGHGRG